MASAGDYVRFRKLYQDISGQLQVVAATDDSTLVTAKSTKHSIFIQKIEIEITTYSAKTWTFTDSAGTPVPIKHISIPAAAVALPSESNTMIADFGPEGVQLTEGKNFLLDVSAAGAAGIVKWQGYQRLTSPVGAFATAAPFTSQSANQ